MTFVNIAVAISALAGGGGPKTISHRDGILAPSPNPGGVFVGLNLRTHRNGILGDFGSFWIGKKDAKIPEVHFGHFLAICCNFFAACQARKYCNLQCFSAFGMKKNLLATC